MVFALVVVVISSALLLQLLNLQIFHGESYWEDSYNNQRRTLTLRGQRGSIYDRNGVPLAQDLTSYDVQFTRDPARKGAEGRKFHTTVIWQAVQIIWENHGSIVNTFPIKQDATGGYYFYWGNISEEAAAKREVNWRKNMQLSETANAEKIVEQLRTRYSLPEGLSFEEEWTLLGIWQDVALNAYRSYMPVTIAKNVSYATVVQLELHNNEMAGVTITRGTTRFYPKGTLASHIIGYTGRISSEMDVAQLELRGYAQDNHIGITGVESALEPILTGNTTPRHGHQEVEVDNVGKINHVISYVPPQSGDSVVLTIDYQMQKKAEEAFQHNLEAIREGTNELVKEDQLADKAVNGGMVVLDVKNCDVLALVSEPGFDLNMVADGLTQEEADFLYKDPRNPMLNYAVGAQSQTPGGTPGSVFKMLVGVAGLQERVITVNTHIDDEGPYDKHTLSGFKSPSCWIGSGYHQHSQQDIVQGLKNSCNYFFYSVADMLGIEKLNKWADLFGLTEKTGVQITGENAGYVASPDVKKNRSFIPLLVKNSIQRLIQNMAGRTATDEVLTKLLALEYGDAREMTSNIRTILVEDMDITDATLLIDLAIEIRQYLYQVQWTPIDTIQAGIGQSTTILSPIAMARYVAALVNGGNIYQANIIKEVVNVQGQVIETNEPKLIRHLDIEPLDRKSTRLNSSH